MKKAIYTIMVCMLMAFMGMGIAHAIVNLEAEDTAESNAAESSTPGLVRPDSNAKSYKVTIEREIIAINLKTRTLKTENASYPLAQDFVAYQRIGETIRTMKLSEVKNEVNNTEGLIHLVDGQVKWITIEE
jgi:Cu/Ag efflux protein CusF